jgi:hypothetical protein
VPDVIGFPIERAAALLTRLGFQVQRIDEPSGTESGRVLALEPVAGEELRLPARVTITVSAPDTTRADTTAARAPGLVPSRGELHGLLPRLRWSLAPNDPIFMVVQTVAPIRGATGQDDF